MKILVLNLMPNKIETEKQIKKVYNNNSKIKFTFLRTESYKSKNTDFNYLKTNYKVFDEIANNKFDGFICTGAPVEKIDFDKVIYWEELKIIFNWVRKKSLYSYFICWGAQAALKIFYNIDKYSLNEKLSGIYPQEVIGSSSILSNLQKPLFIPVSRFTGIKSNDIKKISDLELLIYSKESGPCLIENKKYKEHYNFNHFEYSTKTLELEYKRDKKRGLNVNIPINYFIDDNPNDKPINCWNKNAIIFYNNWLNQFFFHNK